MTIDKSLRVRRGATRNRSVLTRVERIARLSQADRWSEGDSPLGLPKVRVRKLTMKKKKKKKEEEEGATPAAGAAAAAPAAAAGGKTAGAGGKAAGGKAGGGKGAGGKGGK
jgi:small basic protein (TIGR04137 family)